MNQNKQKNEAVLFYIRDQNSEPMLVVLCTKDSFNWQSIYESFMRF